VIRAVGVAALVAGLAAPAGATDDPGAPLKKRLGEAGKPVRLGLVAMPREPLPSTIGNLERFAGVFHRERVAAVIALGELGATEDEIGRSLTALKGAQATVLALPGAREPEAAFHAGVKRAQKAGLDVVDLVEHRAVAGDGLGVEALPGGGWPHYLAEGAVRAAPSELSALDGAIADEKRPSLLVARTPPRTGGPDGIGWASGGADDGSTELAKVLPSLGAKVGAFAAGADVGSRGFDGTAPVVEGQWSERLYVAVGAADAMAPHHGQAVLLELADGKARAKVIR
jgi:hypothetical protein